MQRNFYVDYENTSFLQTSKTGVNPYRLNWRCEILLTRNQEAIKGKRILDLASHDGRFSYACLKLGASHVTGVEGREHLVKFAMDNLTGLGYTQEHFSFIRDDVFDYLERVKPKEFDTILCFGFFDHTIRQIELIREIKRIQPTHFILDMFIERGIHINPFSWLKLIAGVKFRHFFQIPATLEKAKGKVSFEKGKTCLVFKPESHLFEGSTIDPVDLSAWPTKAFLELVFKSHGFSLKQLKWDKKEIKNWTKITDYKYGNRASYIAQPLE